MDTAPGATATPVEKDWVHILHDPEFAGYSIMALSEFCDPQELRMLALGNLRGYIKLLSVAHRGLYMYVSMRANSVALVTRRMPVTLVMYFEIGVCSVEATWKAHEGKVFSLNWVSCINSSLSSLLFSCGPEGITVSVCH